MRLERRYGIDVLLPTGLLSAEEDAILRVLAGRKGKHHAVTVEEIAKETRIEARRVRQVVKHLVEEHQVPIGTSTKSPFGYYILEGDEERREVAKGLVRRALSILRRARAFDKSGWVRRMLGQMEFEMQEGSCRRGASLH
jgi:transcription initiation factor IIE alpha subunit